MGRIIAVPPRMKPRLKILEPITFPIDMSVWLVAAALMVTANSGADVPKATTVNPIIRSEILKYGLSLQQNQPTSRLPSTA